MMRAREDVGMTGDIYRVGNGAGFSGDRIDAGVRSSTR